LAASGWAKIMTTKYHYTLRPLSEKDGGGYLCEFPDFPGVAGDGNTKEEAIADAHRALRAALATLKQSKIKR
jgi:antitoxin HicB